MTDFLLNESDDAVEAGLEVDVVVEGEEVQTPPEEPPPPPVVQDVESQVQSLMFEYGFSRGEDPKGFTLAKVRDGEWRLFVFLRDKYKMRRIFDSMTHDEVTETVLSLMVELTNDLQR